MQSTAISTSVCLSGCPLAYLKNRTAELHQFLCTFPVAVARCSTCSVATCYVLPVLWMTSCLFISSETTASIPIKFCSTINISKYTLWVARQGEVCSSTTALFVVEFWTGHSLLPSSLLEFESLLKVYKLRDHSIVFARWRQQHKNGRVTLGFARHV